MKLVNIVGTNAIGKSTRVGLLVTYLDSKFTYRDISADTRKGHIKVGRLYENGYFMLGKFNGKGVWVSLDLADFSTQQSRHDFHKEVQEKYAPNVFVQEGYFNAGSKHDILEKMNAHGVETYSNYFFVYDNMDQFIARTNGRTGKVARGAEWAEKSAGWRDNKRFNSLYEFYNDLNEAGCTNTKLDLNTPKDYFVQEFFGENYVIPEPEEDEEW